MSATNEQLIQSVMTNFRNSTLGDENAELQSRLMLTTLYGKSEAEAKALIGTAKAGLHQSNTPANGQNTSTQVAVATATALCATASVEPKPLTQQPVPETPNFAEIAAAAVARGETRILPIQVGGKNPLIKWADLPIHNASPAEWQALYADWIKQQATAFPNVNACTVARADEHLYIDEDASNAFRVGYMTFAQGPFPRTHTTSARPDHCQSGWLQTEYSRAKLWNIVQGKTKDQMFSIRYHNLYVLAEGSVHMKSGTRYEAVDHSPLMPIPDKLVDYILSLVVNVSFERGSRVELGEQDRDENGDWFESFSLDEPFIHSNIDNTVKDFIFYYIKHKNVSDGQQLYEIIEKHFEENGCFEPDGVTPFNWNRKQIETKCREKVKSITTGEQDRMTSAAEALAEAAKVSEAAAAQPSKLTLNQQPDVQIPAATASLASAVTTLLVDDDPTWIYAITREEYEAEMSKEYPVVPLKIGPGPGWDDDMMYGVVGDLVRKITVYNEAHPAGIYLDFLVSLGNVIGRDPYFNINSARHYTNEFLVRVGDTSRSRKGSGREEVNHVMSLIDNAWYTKCVMSGFGSGEAVVFNIRDGEWKQIKKRNGTGFESILVPGVDDKRLMIREGELASVFLLASKKDSRADVVLRDGWDSVPLNNRVKGSTNGINNSAAVQCPHVSISADTTRHELIAKMPPGADANGFANRFLYCHVQRMKMCANGGPPPDIRVELEALFRAINSAKTAGYVGMSDAARKLWGRMYHTLEEESSVGSQLAVAIMGRAAPHVRRLALILCLLDEPDGFGYQIQVEHLRAAKRIWDYCADSVRHIFGGLTREEIAIHDWLQKVGPKTITEITQQLFHKNRKVEWVRHQVNALVSVGKVALDGNKVVPK